MRKALCLFAVTAALYLTPAGALAQTKISGTCVLRPVEQHVLAVGDHEGHALGVGQGTCNWTRPIDFGGDRVKDGLYTNAIDADGRAARYSGVLVLTTAREDRVSLTYRATGAGRQGTRESAHVEGTFSLGGGTGNLKNATGKGTFRCTFTPEGGICDIEGEYRAAR